MINGVHHTSISTGNMDRLIAFYRDLLGVEVVFETTFDGPEIEAITALPGAKGRVAMLRSANIHIELFEYANPVPAPHVPNRPVSNQGLTHLCFDVTDLPAEYERLTAAGVEFHCPPIQLTRSVRTTYARDPDGNVIELQEILTDKSAMAMNFEHSPMIN